MMNRRSAIGLISTLSVSACATPSIEKRAQRNILELSSPPDNLTAYIKMRGSLTGQAVRQVTSGRVYGVIEGQRPQPMFGLLGFRIASFERVSRTEFTSRSSYFAVYTDLATGERARGLTNPFTGAELIPPVSRYPSASVSILPDRTVFPGDPLFDPSKRIRPWSRLGSMVSITDEIITRRPLTFQPDLDIVTYHAKLADIQNPKLASAPCTSSFTGVEHWRDWMEMGDTEGSLLWHVASYKLEENEKLPDHLLAEAAREAPEMLREW